MLPGRLSEKHLATIKSVLVTSLDNYSFALVFFLLSIIAARQLELDQLGTFGILLSTYNLTQALFIGCVGEGLIIFRDEKNSHEYLMGFATLMALTLSGLVCTGVFSIFSSGLNLTSTDLLVSFICILLAVMVQGFRYQSLSEGKQIKAAVSGFILIFTTLLSTAFTSYFTDLAPPVRLLLALGTGSALVLLMRISFTRVRFSISIFHKILRTRYVFIRNAGINTVAVWTASHLPQLILGAFINASTLGVLRACLTIINPIQSIEKGFTNSLLIELRGDRKFNIFKDAGARNFGLLAFVNLFFVIMWFLFSELIIEFTIGNKYQPYESVISVLIFIPMIQSIGATSSAILKSFHTFWPQTVGYLLSPCIMIPLVFTINSPEATIYIAFGYLVAAILQSTVILLGLYRYSRSWK